MRKLQDTAKMAVRKMINQQKWQKFSLFMAMLIIPAIFALAGFVVAVLIDMITDLQVSYVFFIFAFLLFYSLRFVFLFFKHFREILSYRKKIDALEQYMKTKKEAPSIKVK